MNDQQTHPKKEQVQEITSPVAITNLDETDWMVMLMKMRIVVGETKIEIYDRLTARAATRRESLQPWRFK